MIASVLFFLLIATIPFGVIGRVTVFPSISLSIQDVFVFFIVISSAKSIVRTLWSKNTFIKLGFLFSFVGFLGIIFEARNIFEFISSVLYLLRLDFYLLFMIPLINIKKTTLKKLRIELLIAGLVFILLGYIQYAFYPNLRNLFYLGWDEHLYRLFSSLLDPNFAGALITLIILFYSTFFFENFKNSRLLTRTLLLFAYAFMIPSLFLTYSRSAYIMFILASLAFLFLARQKKIILLFIAVFVVSLILLPKNFGGEGVKLLRTASIFSRQIEYNNAIKVFSEHPLIGVGFDSLRFVFERYGFVSQKDLLVSHAAAGVPNSYLFLLATIGMLGFVIVVVFLYLAIRKIVGKMTEVPRYKTYSIAVVSSIAGILVHSLFENTLFYAPIMLWLTLVLGIFLGLVKKKRLGF